MWVDKIILVLLAMLAIGGVVLFCIPCTRKWGKLCLNALLFIFMAVVLFVSSIYISFATTRPLIYILTFFIAELSAFILLTLLLWKVRAPKFRLSLLCILAVCLVTGGGFYGYDAYIDSVPKLAENDNLINSYAPFSPDSKAVTLQEPSTLTLTLTLDKELPYLDGATALFPIYSAFAKAVYPSDRLKAIDDFAHPAYNGNEILLCTTTPTAYQRLIDGEADMIFTASASKQQQEEAKEKGVTLNFTPIGKEAFVFFVNSRNPVDDITLEQIQDIYSGEITDWGKLGAPSLGSVKAFQRPQDSGSQTTLQKLMEGRQLISAPKEDIAAGMGGIISKTADYRNFKNAIGYSFRFYATEMVQNNQIKLLAVNGVQPTKETVRDGSYPITSEFYAVTTNRSAPVSQELLDWILSPQGQSIIEQTGYVGIN